MMTINFDTITNNYEVIYVIKTVMKYYLNKIDASFHQCLPNMVQRLSSNMWSVNVNCSSKTTTAGKLSSNSGPGDAGCSTRTTTAGKLSSNTGPGDAGCCNILHHTCMMTINFDTITNNYEVIYVIKTVMKYYLNKIDASFHQRLPNMVQRLFADVIQDRKYI
jgi:hypothetical protein